MPVPAPLHADQLIGVPGDDMGRAWHDFLVTARAPVRLDTRRARYRPDCPLAVRPALGALSRRRRPAGRSRAAIPARAHVCQPYLPGGTVPPDPALTLRFAPSWNHPALGAVYGRRPTIWGQSVLNRTVRRLVLPIIATAALAAGAVT